MLAQLQNYLPGYPWSLLPSAVGVVLVLCLLEHAYMSFKLRDAPGVRARRIAFGSPGAIWWLVMTGYNHANNNLLQFWTSMFIQSDPSKQHVAEISFGGRRMIMTNEPEHIKTILATKFTQYGKGPLFHEITHPFLGDSIFSTDGELWHQSRSLIRPMFIKDKVRDLHIFDSLTDKLISKLPQSGNTVDICDLFYRMTLDVTTEFLLGQCVGSLDNVNEEFGKAFENVQRTQMHLIINPDFGFLIPQKKYTEGIKLIEDFMEPFIQSTLALSPSELENLSKSDKEFTFLHNIALYSRDPKVIRDQIMAILLAGRDTTAATLSWTLYELSNYPRIWQKLRNHVLEKVGPTETPTYEDLKNLTYLTHALNETLRLYPAVPYNVRTAAENTVLPGRLGEPDIVTMKADSVVYSPFAMQRRKDLYPPASEKFADPGIYSPDRWSVWTPKPWQYIPFNGGPRICVGQNFAMTEMAFTMVKLLQKYERIEYRGDWAAQYHKASLVGSPGDGVPIALYEARK